MRRCERESSSPQYFPVSKRMTLSRVTLENNSRYFSQMNIVYIDVTIKDGRFDYAVKKCTTNTWNGNENRSVFRKVAPVVGFGALAYG